MNTIFTSGGGLGDQNSEIYVDLNSAAHQRTAKNSRHVENSRIEISPGSKMRICPVCFNENIMLKWYSPDIYALQTTSNSSKRPRLNTFKARLFKLILKFPPIQ
jgi:hypothetical protein